MILIGMHELPEGFTVEEGIVLGDPSDREFHLHPKDTVKSHTIMPPQANKLIDALKPHADLILKLTRTSRKRNESTIINHPPSSLRSPSSSFSIHTPFFPSENFSNTPAFTPMSPSLSSSELKSGEDYGGTTSTAPQVVYNPLPLPIELDLESSDCKQLLTAVSSFSSIMTAHLQALCNTAIQSAWDLKYKKRNLTRLNMLSLTSRQQQQSSMSLKETRDRHSSVGDKGGAEDISSGNQRGRANSSSSTGSRGDPNPKENILVGKKTIGSQGQEGT